MRPEPASREQSGPRINDQIRAREVRLIDEAGQNVGVVAKFDAIARAEEAGLDLVEISPDARSSISANTNSRNRRKPPRPAKIKRSSS
jgi:translation initiation factor IF-3